MVWMPVTGGSPNPPVHVLACHGRVPKLGYCLQLGLNGVYMYKMSSPNSVGIGMGMITVS